MWTCTLIICIASVVLHANSGFSHRYTDSQFTTSALTGVQIGAALALMATIFSIQRRPAVFAPNGREVDTQRTGSLWSRYSFHWGLPILRAAGTEKFENSDLPAMDHVVRAENATANFKRMIFKDDSLPLWAHISWKYRYQFLFQWSATLFTNFFDVAPAFANLQLLRYLENRNSLDVIDPVAWKWVGAIVLATISSRLVDSRVMWSEMAGIYTPSTFLLSMYIPAILMFFCRHCYSFEINFDRTHV